MVKRTLLVLGIVLIAIGIIGYFNDPVFGIFDVDILHTTIHLLTGVAAVLYARTQEETPRTGTKLLGVVYLVLSVLGFVWPNDMLFGLIQVNTADNVLHILFAFLFLAVGFATAPQSEVSSIA